MRIDSEYPYRAFWRMFVSGDTVYAAGWREGVLYNGGWVDDMNHPAGQFQLEVKHDGLFGRFLVRAGSLWSNDDELVLTQEGQLRRVEDMVEVENDPIVNETLLGTARMFFDRLTSNADISIEITSTLSSETITSITRSVDIGATSGTESSIGAEGNVSAKVDDAASGGLKITASSKVTFGASRKLTQSLGEQIKTTQTESAKYQEKLLAQKITVIASEWKRRFRTGQARVGQKVYPYEYTTQLVPSWQVRHYASVAEMPRDVFDEYSRRFPGRGLAALRGNPQIVDGNGWLGLMKLNPVDASGSVNGSIYGDGVSGRWEEQSRLLHFIRTINSNYLQSWRGEPNAGEGMLGTFFEEVDGTRQPQIFDWASTPYLKVNGNGHLGEMFIMLMNSDGSFTAKCYGDAITGSWNQSGGTINFIRDVGPQYQQHWTGTRRGLLSFEGTFFEVVDGQRQPGEYSWNAISA